MSGSRKPDSSQYCNESALKFAHEALLDSVMAANSLETGGNTPNLIRQEYGFRRLYAAKNRSNFRFGDIGSSPRILRLSAI
jgi:hypothetical protein